MSTHADGGAPVVGVVMGSDSDWPVMEGAVVALEEFGVACEVDVVSAHRMPEEMVEYGRSAAGARAARDHRRVPGVPPTCRGCSRRSPRCR